MAHSNKVPLLAATEDPLSLAVVRRLVENRKSGFQADKHTALKGNTYLRKKAKGLARSATPYQPALLLTDLDSGSCPAALRKKWLGRVPLPESMLFRVAVREVEAWVMADRKNFAEFFKIPKDKIPDNPEDLPDPKDVLLRLIHQHSKIPSKGEIVVVGSGRKSGKRYAGPRYNEVLSEFVEKVWRPDLAAKKAPSLARTRQRIKGLAKKFAPL